VDSVGPGEMVLCESMGSGEAKESVAFLPRSACDDEVRNNDTKRSSMQLYKSMQSADNVLFLRHRRSLRRREKQRWCRGCYLLTFPYLGWRHRSRLLLVDLHIRHGANIASCNLIFRLASLAWPTYDASCVVWKKCRRAEMLSAVTSDFIATSACETGFNPGRAEGIPE
jgi:hypothetical protein